MPSVVGAGHDGDADVVPFAYAVWTTRMPPGAGVPDDTADVDADGDVDAEGDVDGEVDGDVDGEVDGDADTDGDDTTADPDDDADAHKGEPNVTYRIPGKTTFGQHPEATVTLEADGAVDDGVVEDTADEAVTDDDDAAAGSV